MFEWLKMKSNEKKFQLTFYAAVVQRCNVNAKNKTGKTAQLKEW